MLTVLMPSRGREKQAAEAYAAFAATKTRDETKMVIVLDVGEPGYDDLPAIRLIHDGGMGNALNAGVKMATNTTLTEIVAFIGDDHFFRTIGWDDAIVAANDELGGGIVYGNDLLRGEDLPSQVFIDARIVRALGWMALPGATHLFFDDTWRTLGHSIGRLKYLPDVHIEHRHPTAGKADWDEGYARVNSSQMYEHDAAIYWDWVEHGLAEDTAKVLAALK